MAGRYKELKGLLNLSNNDFIRTTDQKRHWPAVRKIWLKLKENNDIYKKKYKGLYCVGCEAFIKEKDLIDGKCPNHQKEPEIIEEENYFFKLSKYSNQVKKLIETGKIRIIPESKKNEILSFIKQGVEDISCSRSREKLKWGIPVPEDDTQTIYIWLEALINYISVLGYAKDEDKFKKYWPADVHCVGKDIFRFHSLLWPALLLSMKLPLPKAILVHGFITVDGQKISKSLGNVIDPFELVKKYSSKKTSSEPQSNSSLQVGTDAVRYFLLREIPSTEDGDFTYKKFEGRYDSDLASGLGNLVARVLKLAENFEPCNSDLNFKKEIERAQNKCKKYLEEFKFNEALASIWELITFCDRYIEKEKPWEEKSNKKEVIGNLLFAISEIAKLLEPFLPETAEKILNQLTLQRRSGLMLSKAEALKTQESQLLFPRL